MTALNLKPTHRPIKSYYAALNQFTHLNVTHETAVRTAFQTLLEHCARQCRWTLVPEHALNPRRGKRIVIDGALIDDFRLTHGYWEAKDDDDDLPAEIDSKFAAGYPRDNILFQTPRRAMLWQNDRLVLDADLTDPKQLIDALQIFFSYRPQEYAAWDEAVVQFKDRVADIGQGLAKLIRQERSSNQRFTTAFAEFLDKSRQSINPNLSEAAVEEMLIQHMLTERLFRTVFNNPDFTRRNVIANEIAGVIDALTSQSFSRDEFLKSLDHFYVAIERTAATISDFLAQAALSQHRLRAVFPGLLHQSRRHTRHRLHAAADRRLHGAQRGRDPGAGVRPFAGRRGRPHHRPLRGHRQLHRAHDARDPAHSAGAQVQGGAALQRSDAAALLHRQHEHRARVLRRHWRLQALQRHLPGRHLRPGRGPAAATIRAGEHAAGGEPEADADVRRDRQPALQRGAGQRERQQQEPQVPDDGQTGAGDVFESSKATLKNALADPVCQGDSLGVGPHRRRRGRCQLCDQQQLS